MDLLGKFQDNKDFYLGKYQKYKDKKKKKELKSSRLLSYNSIKDMLWDYADVLERSNKPLSRKWGKAIKDFNSLTPTHNK